MWLLGINVGHNGAAALYKDSELIFYIEEDRLSSAGPRSTASSWHL